MHRDDDPDTTESGGADARGGPGDGDDPDHDGDPDGTDGADTDDADRPAEVGDGRRKHVSVVTASGEQIDHGDVFLRHSVSAFVVSPSPSFDAEETTRYRKADLARVEVTQHHSACFVTTAAAGDGPTLDALRAFRDDALAPTSAGRALLGIYDAVSPRVAATLARHPDARTTRGVRWLVDHCGTLARRRNASDRPGVRAALSLLLTALYAVGVAFAVGGACAIRLRERTV